MITNMLLIPAPARRMFWIISALIVSAWGLLIIWQGSHYAELLGHESLGHHHLSFPVKLSAFTLSWALMTVAMMLPASIPALIHSAQITGQRESSALQLTGAILGYLIPWTVFGLLAFLGDAVLHEFAEPGAPLQGLAVWIAPSIALAAGLYQFTPVKWRFTLQCRPAEEPHTRTRSMTLASAVRDGARLGLVCMASCGLLMLLMFAAGHHNLGWMLVLGLVFVGERLSAWGRSIARLVGAVLIILAAFWLYTGAFVG